MAFVVQLHLLYIRKRWIFQVFKHSYKVILRSPWCW